MTRVFQKAIGETEDNHVKALKREIADAAEDGKPAPRSRERVRTRRRRNDRNAREH